MGFLLCANVTNYTLFRRCYNIPKIPEDPEPKIGEKETLL